jgi:formylglycine-generating enzyme required for sulfatase activity
MTRTENAPRVLRGGSWDYDVPSWVSAASHDSIEPAFRFDFIGFRCALRGRQPL